jgi:hypothetical protein
MIWHQKWSDCNIGRVQTLLATPRVETQAQLIEPKHTNASSCPKPKYAACCLSKTGRASAPTTQVLDTSERNLSDATINPGDVIHLDQYMSRLPGRLPTTFGKEKSKKRYAGGTISVDGKTGFVHHHHQVSLLIGETLQGKNRFEKGSRQFNVPIISFRADNAPFNAAEFQSDLDNKGQTITFSSVGVHHQNGAAERAIKTITSWSRTMMLHAILHWPEQTTLDMWPFAMDHAVYCWNHLPSKNDRISPLEAFTGTRFSNYEHLKCLHVWGSPCYVLDPRLQDEKKIPKWEPRCRRGQHLGVSLEHSTTVARILNTRTGYVSPQYHVLHDDSFTTVVSMGVNWLHFMPLQWHALLQTGYERYLDPDFDRTGQPLPAPMLDDE